MKTVLHQGRQSDEHNWMVLPADLVDGLPKTKYQVRELVPKAEADAAVVKLVEAAKAAREELKFWMKHHGQDIDSQNAIDAINAALLAAGAA